MSLIILQDYNDTHLNITMRATECDSLPLIKTPSSPEKHRSGRINFKLNHLRSELIQNPLTIMNRAISMQREENEIESPLPKRRFLMPNEGPNISSLFSKERKSQDLLSKPNMKYHLKHSLLGM